MGYTGPAQQDDINKFMMSSPKAASMMGKYAEMAKARVQGGPQTAMQVGGTVVGKGGQYFIKDAQGGYSQSYSTALDAYYANKGQSTNTATGAAVQPYAGLNTGTTDNMPNTTGGFDMGVDIPVKKPSDFIGGPALPGPVDPLMDRIQVLQVQVMQDHL